MEEERQPKSAGLDLWHFGQLSHGLTWSRGLRYRAIKRQPDCLWTDVCVAGIGVARHRRADAPVGLGRASGSVPWGRGSRRREREPVFPDHSSDVILQPDRLLQACLHPSLSISLSPSLILSILVFLLLLSSVSPFFLPRCSCCHPSSLYLLHPILQSSFRPAVTVTPSLSLPSSKSFITVCQAARLSQHHFLFYISLTIPLISSIGSSLCPSDGPSFLLPLPLCFPPSSLF